MNKIISFSKNFILTAFTVTAVSVTTTYVILKHNLDEKITRQKSTAELVTSQIQSANLNSLLGFRDEFFIFVVHQRDKRVLFESAQRKNEALRLWQESGAKLIEQMNTRQPGALVYPNFASWKILAYSERVEYRYLPDLDWIVAVVLPASVSAAQLLSVYTPFIWFMLILFCVVFAGFLTFSRRELAEPFSQKFAESVKAAESPPVEASHPVETMEYKQRLIQAAQDAFNEDPPEKNQAPLKDDLKKDKQAQKAGGKNGESQREEPALEEAQAKEHLKGVSANLNKTKEPVNEHHADETEQKTKEEEKKKASEIYFEHIIHGKSYSRKKPEPNSIIGLALSKKKNREKFED